MQGLKVFYLFHEIKTRIGVVQPLLEGRKDGKTQMGIVAAINFIQNIWNPQQKKKLMEGEAN